VLVSGTVRDLIAGAGIELAPRGALASGRVGDRRPLFAVVTPPVAPVAGAGANARSTATHARR
jgi:hypothetical protein